MWKAKLTEGSATSWAGGPAWYKEMDWTSQEEHASKQHSLMASAPVAALVFLRDGLLAEV